MSHHGFLSVHFFFSLFPVSVPNREAPSVWVRMWRHMEQSWAESQQLPTQSCQTVSKCALIFYCWIINYHKRSSFKLQIYLSHSFCRSEIRVWRYRIPWSGSHRADIRVSAAIFIWHSEFSSELTHHWQNLFACGCRTKDLFSCWLSVEGCSQFLRAVPKSFECGSSVFKPAVAQ